MADRADVTPTASSQPPGREEQGGGEDGGSSEGDANSGLTDAQRQVLERCVHALTHATNDSQMLAALLLISRLCPASDLDKPTLKRIFEAVGLSLPVRLLLTAVRGGENSGLPPRELLSLGIALLAALSTEPDMACSPELLRTIPLLLSLLANGFMFNQQKQEEPQMDESPECNPAGGAHSAQEAESSKQKGEDGGEASRSAAQEASLSCSFDAALAADCYLILTAVCTLPRGPEQLLSRGAVAAVCQAVQLNRPFSRDRGLVVLGFLLSGKNKDKAWRNHTTELLSLVIRLSKDFCQSTNETRLDMCAQLAQFLPPAGVATENERLKEAVRHLWEVLRPMVQAKLTQTQIGPILVLCACLLDLYGWDIVGPPKFCCLLVNRACVEVRLGLEAPPGNDLSPELQDTLTGCYRIMEAAIEQACSPGVPQGVAPPQSALSLQQSRQILRVLEEAFSALIYYLQQVRKPNRLSFSIHNQPCVVNNNLSCDRHQSAIFNPSIVDPIVLTPTVTKVFSCPHPRLVSPTALFFFSPPPLLPHTRLFSLTHPYKLLLSPLFSSPSISNPSAAASRTHRAPSCSGNPEPKLTTRR
uniref:Neurochondrin n=1 Tax=Amphilophus citrinellus TaxID=61819 RepID=A0A3Q0S8Z9_AMPCI